MTLSGDEILGKAPSTRYQGSKRTILPWIYENLRELHFSSVLDGFGGSASVSYLFKLMGKKVTFNDILSSNYMTAVGLIENQSVTLSEEDLTFILHKNGFRYPTFIEDTFKGIYYLPSENRWLDVVRHNIRMLCEIYPGDELRAKQALAYHALFQACLCKRPFNLFHRKNLYLRRASVQRSFGNRTTWDTRFPELFLRFSAEANARVFATKPKHTALCRDIMSIRRTSFDLVYLDPPYARKERRYPNNYHSMYHFLEGLVDYDNWPAQVNWETRNRALVRQTTRWDTQPLEDSFDALFRKFKESLIVVSYGHPGNPSLEAIANIMRRYKSDVRIITKSYNYKLNHKNGGLFEVLIIGT